MQVRIERNGAAPVRIPLSKLVTTIGMGEGCDLILAPAERPVRLGMFIRKEPGYSFKPLPSGKGLSLKGRPIVRMVDIRPGELLEYPGYRIMLEEDGKDLSEELPGPKAAVKAEEGLRQAPGSQLRLARVDALSAYGQPLQAVKKQETPSGQAKTTEDAAYRGIVLPELDSAQVNSEDAPYYGAVVPLQVRLHCELMRRIEDVILGASGDSESVLREAEGRIDAVLDSFRETGRFPAGSQERAGLKDRISRELRGLGPLSQLFGEGEALELSVEAWSRIRVMKSKGAEQKPGCYVDKRHFELHHAFLRRIATPLSQAQKGVFHGLLADGLMLRLISAPPSLEGPILQARRPLDPSVGLQDLEFAGILSGEMVQYLGLALKLRRTFLVCGGPGSGKSLLAGALLEGTGSGDRIAVVEQWPAIRGPQDRGVFLLAPDPAAPHASPEFRRILEGALALRPGWLLLDGSSPEWLAEALLRIPKAAPAAMLLLESGGAVEALALAESAIQERLKLPSSRVRSILAGAVDVVLCMRSPEGAGPKLGLIAETAGAGEGGVILREVFSWRGGESGSSFTRGAEQSALVREARSMGISVPFQSYREIEA